ncbi:MAG: glycosyl hydrolase family 28-related protein [Tepidisphaeraceae bacterium]
MTVLHPWGVSGGKSPSNINVAKGFRTNGFRKSHRRFHGRLRAAIQAVIEPLEQRVLLSVSVSPTNIYAVETKSFDPGDLDGTGSVYVASGNSLSADRVREQSLTVDGSMVIDPGSGDDDPSHASVVDNLVMDTNSSGQFLGTLDLTDNALIIETTASNRQNVLNMLQAALYSGYNGGSWNGTGIISSTAASNSNYGLGFIVNDGNYNYSTGTDGSGGASAIHTSYAGQTVDANSIIVAYTLVGDTNLDGLVDGTDFTTLASHLAQQGIWATGDFNYDGVVNDGDFTSLVINEGRSVSFSAAPDTSTAPQYVATFTGATDGLASGYTATISWGDGTSPTAGTIIAAGGGNYDVLGTHTYPLDPTSSGVTTGTYNVSVQVTETATEDTSTAISTAYVTFVPDLMIDGAASATNSPYSLDLSAMFATDFDGAMNDISSWTVDWGDGDTQTYYQTPTFNPGWAVVTHSYSGSTGLFDITATAFDGTHTYTAPETIPVALNFSGSGNGAIQTTQGQSYSGPVATFVGTPDGDTSNYSASINWGDGSTVASGSIVYEGGENYEVTGSYTYEQEGTFGIQVGITEADDGAQVSVNSTADVAVAPTTASAITLPGILPTYSPNGPASNPTLPSGMNTFTLNTSEISGSPGTGAPIFAASDPTAQPDQTITVTGSNFTVYPNETDAFADTQFIVYGQTSSSNGRFSDAQIQDPTLNGAMLTIGTSEPANSMYLVWAVNASGASAPIAVNDTTAWWAGAPTEPIQQSQSPTSVSAYLGQTLSVYGENLSNGAATPQSWVYLQPTGGGSGTWATVTAVNPYKVDFTVPGTLTVGDTYQIWINNGLGGQYSWSEAPTTLSVAASSAPTWSGTTINVTSYGAVGDGKTNDYSKIQSALDVLQPGDTLYFPAGTYLVNDTSGAYQLLIPTALSDIRIEGTAASTTIIIFGGATPSTGFGAFELGQPWYGGAPEGPIEFDSMTLEYNGTGGAGELLSLRHSTGDTFNGVTLHANSLEPIDATGASEFTITNSTIFGGTENGSIFLSGGADDFFNSDTFLMQYDPEAALNIWGSQNVSVTNCVFQDYDDSADNSSGFGLGRILDAPANGGSQSNYYFSNNASINLTPDPFGPGNDGEQINTEGDIQPYHGSIVSAGSDTVSVDISGSPTLSIGEYVLVVSGTGMGELEPITGVSNSGDRYTLTLGGNWNDEPDSTSTIEVLAEIFNLAFISNSLSDATGAYGNAGFESWDGGYSEIFANNIVQNVATGAVLASALPSDDGSQSQPQMFTEVINNQLENTLQGVDLGGDFESAPDGTPNDVGVIIRDNSVDGGVAGVTVDGHASPATLAVIEHNLIATSAETGIVYYPNSDMTNPIVPGAVVVQGDDFGSLAYDNTIVEPDSIEGSSYPLPAGIYYDTASTSGILLRNNQYENFDSSVYGYASGVSSPSLFAMPTDVLYATAVSGDSSNFSFALWDDGAASRSWSAAIESGTAWLTVASGDSSSGTISGEDDNSSDSNLYLTANSSGLSTGTHTATVTITAGSQTRVVTVVFTVT